MRIRSYSRIPDPFDWIELCLVNITVICAKFNPNVYTLNLKSNNSMGYHMNLILERCRTPSDAVSGLSRVSRPLVASKA